MKTCAWVVIMVFGSKFWGPLPAPESGFTSPYKGLGLLCASSEGAYYISFPCADAIFQVVPEDVPMSLIAVYGFSPPIRLGRDHRVGFGFRFGNHADVQLMYEFGPQIRTKPLQPVKVRSAAYRVQRRRPLVELLLRAGLLQEAVYDEDAAVDKPR